MNSCLASPLLATSMNGEVRVKCNISRHVVIEEKRRKERERRRERERERERKRERKSEIIKTKERYIRERIDILHT